MISHLTYGQQLYVGNHTTVYRGKRDATGVSVIIKVLRSDYPTPHEIALLTYEYEIAKRLVATGIIPPLELITDQRKVALIIDDVGGDSLLDIMARQPFDIGTFLDTTIHLANLLMQMHQQQVIHKDIKPANIVMNPAANRLHLIDFGISSLLTSENAPIRNPNQLEGTLAYMSPEQTGRVNRVIDYRTDFYSLGVTCYEMLTGTLPFRSNDPMELVHAHIAKIPPAPHELDPTIPLPLSTIVMKLMAKPAESRYQSAYGLKADLEECRRQWLATGSIAPFELGTFDQSDIFQLPQKLYGREVELAQLQTRLQRSVAGAVEVVLIRGYGGIGKSSLVAELNKAIVEHHGYFITGKFDQLHRNIPYSALVTAFSDLIRQLLAESVDQVDRWRTALTAALGVNAQIMIDLIPELELIIGKQAPAVELPVTEAQNRFNSLFQRFMRVFAQPEHPLVLFFDDLQWIDSASLALLEIVLADTELKHILVIGAYRDNELTAVHPLVTTLKSIQTAGIAVESFNLAPLGLGHITALVGDALHLAPADVQPLADIVWNKTRGNPFFINQFLLTLVEQRAVWFDGEQGRWRWDIDVINTMSITDNVVELMADKIQRLDPATVQVLQRAACIGNQFDLETLAVISQQSITHVGQLLWSAIQEGLIIPISENYKFLHDQHALLERVSFSEQIRYRFLHDRVQQAAYSLISDAERQALHLAIGRLLRQSASHYDADFDVINHLNIGSDLMTDPAERVDLAILNSKAGQRAKAANAYALALQYLTIGISLLGDQAWQHHHDLACALHTDAAEAAYSLTDFGQMQTYCTAVLRHARAPLEKTRIYELQISFHTAQNQVQVALSTARTALAELGVMLPLKPTLLHVARGLITTMAAMRGKKPQDLAQLPMMTDPTKKAAMRILMSTVSAAYIASPNLFPLIAFNMVGLSLQFGNSPLSPFGYIVYAILLSAAVGNLKGGYELGLFAFDLGKRLHADEIKAKLYVSLYVTLTHWRTALRDTLAPFLAGFQSGIDAGDVEYTCHNAMYYCYYLLCTGESLDFVAQQQQHYLAIIRHYKQEFHVTYTVIWKQVVDALRQPDQSLAAMCAPLEAMLPDLERTQNGTSLFCCHSALCQLHYMFGNPQQAVKHSHHAAKYAQAVLGSISIPELTFYAALATIAQIDQLPAARRPRVVARLAGSMRKLKKWAANAPMNYAPKYFLVCAESARQRGQFDAASRLYDRAIKAAREHGYMHIEALANELAGRWYVQQDKQRIANHYLQEARYLYQRWGAHAKISQLDREFRPVLETQHGYTVSTLTTASITRPSGTGHRTDHGLDLGSVLKATQAITGEIVLPTLLAKLMRIMIENAGAQRGVLLIPRNGTFVIEAEGSTEHVDVTVLQSIPLTSAEGSQLVSAAIVQYVARLREPVVLANASQDGAFTRDAYVLQHQPQAILCAPLLHRGELSAVVYLENNITAHAFAPERLEVIQMLSGEAAISIENAHLYANMEHLVAERTNALLIANRSLEEITSRLQRELALAHTIQQGLLPPSHPEWHGFDIISFTNPVREVGGDFYAYQANDQGFGVAVGDVSGKGMPAALLMAVSVALLRSSTVAGLMPSDLLTRLNRDISSYTRTTRQNCALCCILLADNAMYVSNAGGIPPLVRHANGTTEWIDVGGLPLGSSLNALVNSYQEVTVPITAGDSIVLVSDGFIEAMNSAGEMFGFERFEQTIANAPAHSAQAMLQFMNQQLMAYIGAAAFHDDVTIVVIQRT